MTRRERLLTALDHREADRVPLGFDATEPILQALCSHFGVASRYELYDAMGIDGFSVFSESYVYPEYIGPPPLQLADGSKSDFFGIVSQRHYPLAFAESIADLDDYRWPNADWFDYRTIKERCRQVKARDLPVVGGEGGCGITHTINLRGFEKAVCDPLLDEKLASAYLERMGDFFVEWNERWLAAADGEFDIFRCGDEVGSNVMMHCSPELWRKYFKPQLARVFAIAKRHNMKIWYHCCGYCRPIIPDLLEIGVDMWDPVPPSVAGNDHAWLKREYGRDLSFIGGIDHPNVLVGGSANDVVEDVKRRIELLAPGGGFILGAAQTMTEDIPLANILALYETALEYGKYTS